MQPSIKTIIAAATFATLTAIGGSAASAAPWNHNMDHRDYRDAPRQEQVIRQDRHFDHRQVVMRERVYDTLRFHRYRGVGNPMFVRGHYVVRSFDRRGRVVFVEVNPYTGRLIGEFRV